MGDFNTPLLSLGRSAIQKLNREKKDLTDVMTQMGSTAIYRTLHPRAKEYIPSSKHLIVIAPKVATYSAIKQISIVNKKTGIILCVLLDLHDLKLEFNNNTSCRKPTDSWKLNNAQLNHHWVKKEIKKLKIS